jgi:protein-S-isoprenylcysteine O-methyltransferase Ste14
MSTLRYVFAVGLIIGLPPALLMWFIVHPFVDFWRRLGVKASLAINLMILFAGMVGLWSLRERLVGADLGTSWALVALGVVLVGVAIRIAAARKKYLTWRILVGVPELASSEDEKGTLLDQGPYAHVRNPRYIEVLVGAFAYACIANYVGAYLVALATLPLLHLIVLLEERELRARFGAEYERYCDRVPRYVPRSVRRRAR